jgi:hypothetical protein
MSAITFQNVPGTAGAGHDLCKKQPVRLSMPGFGVELCTQRSSVRIVPNRAATTVDCPLTLALLDPHRAGNRGAVQLLGVVHRCVFNMNEHSTTDRDMLDGSISEHPVHDLR